MKGLNEQTVLAAVVASLFFLISDFGTQHCVAEGAGLSRAQAERVCNRLWTEWANANRRGLEKERNNLSIMYQGNTLRLLEKRFGNRPQNGHSLFISMHGGGGGPAQMNDGQWKNQIRLYAPGEGIVVAPRAPGNTWDLWHKAHIDPLFDRLIQSYVVAGLVDPNRVYLMGYSAGGDGVFQVAPRMSDRFAAASMMAGHPNETQPDGLRNLPFSIWMGGRDSAYKRNQIAAEWKKKLAGLRQADIRGYPHLVTIYPDSGHWMNGRDRAALPWMQKFTRNSWPKKVVWLQDDVTHSRLYWLGVRADEASKGDRIEAEVTGQQIRVTHQCTRLSELRLLLSDNLLNLDRPVEVIVNGKGVHNAIVPRSEKSIRDSLKERPDRNLIATATLQLKIEK